MAGTDKLASVANTNIIFTIYNYAAAECVTVDNVTCTAETVIRHAKSWYQQTLELAGLDHCPDIGAM
jgi:hypothetical protein